MLLTSDDTRSRFFRRGDPRIAAMHVGHSTFHLPATWWSRGYEYAWAQRFVDADNAPIALDAACGVSHPFKFWLTAHARDCYACDIDSRILSKDAILADVQADFGDVHGADALRFPNTACASITTLPYPSAFFDAVFCISVLEHMPREQMTDALSEFRRVTKPTTGRVVLTFDVPSVNVGALRTRILDSGLAFIGDFDDTEEGAVFTPDYGGLRCFRAALAVG